MKINWKRVFSIVVFIIISLVCVFIALMIVGVWREEHCHQEAKRITGANWHLSVEVTPEEQKKYSTGNKISWLLKEQLKCEAEFGGGAILGWLILLSPFAVGAFLLLRKKHKTKK